MLTRRLPLVLAALFSALSLIATTTLASAADLEANEKVAYESVLLWTGNSDLKAEDVFAPNYVNHVDTPISADAPSSRDLKALEEELAQYHSAFSDVEITSSEQLAQGDMVATRVVISAKHTGSFVGEEPTGKTVTYDSVEFSRIEDGKIAETWVTWDKFGLYRQINALSLAD